MEILKNTMLEKKVKLSEEEMNLAIRNFINSSNPEFLTNEEMVSFDDENLIFGFKYNPDKNESQKKICPNCNSDDTIDGVPEFNPNNLCLVCGHTWAN